jgi:phosphohistidine phosphatase
MRHARAAPSGVGGDHARPLDAIGRMEAADVARHLFATAWSPDHVVTSDAVRTRETWSRMEPVFPDPPTVSAHPALYGRGAEATLGVLSMIQAGPRTVFAIGHNPDQEILVEWLCGAALSLGTANAVLLAVHADDWPSAYGRAGGFRLVDRVRPRLL